MKISKKKLAEAKDKYGVDITIDKRLNVYSGKTLFPAKLEKVNKLIATLELK